MSQRLSEAQYYALKCYEGFLTDTRREYDAVTRGISDSVLLYLEECGLIEPYNAGYQDWRFRITDAGRKALESR